MGFFSHLSYDTPLSHRHRQLLRQLMKIEVDFAYRAYTLMRFVTDGSRVQVSAMRLSAYIGTHFGIYCMMKASSILKDKLTDDSFEIEEDALIRMFVEDHRNIITIEEVANIFANITLGDWRQDLEEHDLLPWSYCLDQADRLIEEYYNNL